MKWFMYMLFLFGLGSFYACASEPDAEEEAALEEMDKVDELRKSDEARMDSMRRELGVQ